MLLFAGMAGVVVIAATHRESMVSENYYEQELKFQDQIDSAARAQKSGAGHSAMMPAAGIGGHHAAGGAAGAEIFRHD